MRAIKIYNIKWNLNSIDENKRTEVKENLPRVMCFTVKDDFDVVSKVPNMFVKRFGVEVENFSYVNLRVVGTIEDLLFLSATDKEKNKRIFSKKGEVTEFGQKMIDIIKDAIRGRKALETDDTPIEKIPTFYDEVMIAIENITGMEWLKCTDQEVLKEFDALIEVLKDDIAMKDAIEKERVAKLRKKAKNLLKKEEKEAIAAAAAEEEEDDEDYDEEEEEEEGDEDYDGEDYE
jgi:hypothetical protein